MRNFFKVTLTSTALLLGSASVVAESATVPEFGAIFQMKTADQASVAAAFVQFAQSECRQQAPTAIRIMAEIDEVIEAHGGWPGAFQTGDAGDKPVSDVVYAEADGGAMQLDMVAEPKDG